MEGPQKLREKAERFRQMALTIIDKQAVVALRDLAEEYEALAIQLEAAVLPRPSSEN